MSSEAEYLARLFIFTSGSPRDKTTPGDIDYLGPNWLAIINLKFWI